MIPILSLKIFTCVAYVGKQTTHNNSLRKLRLVEGQYLRDLLKRFNYEFDHIP